MTHEAGRLTFGRTASDERLRDDRRREQRHTVLLRTAKFIADGLEFLCIIREVFGTGIKLQLFHTVSQAASFVLEMPNGDLHPMDLAWSAGDLAGFRFLEGIDIPQFIQASASENARKYIRLQNQMRGTLTAAGKIIPISFINISQQGARVECHSSLAIGQLVVIDMGVLPPTFAKVQWRRRPHYGLIFEQIYQFEELARKLVPSTPL